MTKKAVIVGAGYAGVAAALYLNKKGKKDNLEITLIDKNDYHTLLTELHEVAGNRQDEETIRIALKDIFRDTSVRLVQDSIDHFDFENKRLVGSREEYAYDYCVVAIGSKPAFYGIEGLEENAFTLWSYDDAVEIRDHVRNCFEKAALEQDPAERSRLLTFAVGGAGFTGVEMIGELAHWVKTLARENNIERKEVRLILIDMLDRVLPVLDEKNSAKSHKYMTEKLGIEVMLETGINKMSETTIETSKGNIETRTLIWCAGVCCSNESESLGLERQGRGGRIKVEDTCLTEHEGVYAVGDCGALAGDDGIPYAAMVENAIQSGDGAAANILRQIRGQKPERVEVKFHGTMVCIGNYFAVSEIMGKRLPSWLSVVMKFMVNVHYLFEIMGFRGPFNYLKNELVNRRQDKLFLEKHYSRKMQAWWLFPLRMFMGFYWLLEGIKKVTEGWFNGPKLAEFSGLSRGYQLASDAVSAATGGGLRIDEIFDIKLHIVNLEVAYASKMIEGVAVTKDMFAKIDIFNFGSFNLVPWIMENWALSSQGWEMFFQIVVTLVEIALGLMLLSGTFTFLASVGTIAMMAMFVTSTGLYFHTWWLGFAAIATMGGAGRAFGMDHYVLPWLNRVWESIWKNRKLKLIFPRQKKSIRKQKLK
jgi:NADH dehydrogenase